MAFRKNSSQFLSIRITIIHPEDTTCEPDNLLVFFLTCSSVKKFPDLL